MKFMRAGFYQRMFAVFLSASLFNFLFYHILITIAFDSSFLDNSALFEVFYTVYNDFFSPLVRFLLPIIGATALLPTVLSVKWIRAYPYALLMAAGSSVSNILYYYEEYVYGGYSSGEAVLIALLAAVFYVMVDSLLIALLALLAKVILKHKGADLSELSRENSVFDFSRPVPFSVFIICLTVFCVRIAAMIIDTVVFFIDYGKTATVEEILLLTARYVFALVLMLLGEMISILILNKYVTKRITEAEDSE